MTNTEPIAWVPNSRPREMTTSDAVTKTFPDGIFKQARSFHQQIPGYQVSPLKSLSHLAEMMGVGGIWVKDESARLDLNSFKVLGGSFAIYRFIRTRLGLADDEKLSFNDLMSDAIRTQLEGLIFATATDGNHGRGVAWAATQLGCQSMIYVHKDTSQARIRAIEEKGAIVTVVNGTYDDAVRQVTVDAEKHGWQIISDTSWEGYQDVPTWVMQGYATLLAEAQDQLNAVGIVKPTHVFVQAGVGALAAATLGFYRQRFGAEQPIGVVVEPSEAACLLHSAHVADGKAHNIGGDLQTIMAGLACGEPSPLAWDVLWDCADTFVACPDYGSSKGDACLCCAA